MVERVEEMVKRAKKMGRLTDDYLRAVMGSFDFYLCPNEGYVIEAFKGDKIAFCPCKKSNPEVNPSEDVELEYVNHFTGRLRKLSEEEVKRIFLGVD